jgi:hypothetical protein
MAAEGLLNIEHNSLTEKSCHARESALASGESVLNLSSRAQQPYLQQ